MSLKSFHLFFIAVSVLTALGFGVWCLTHAPAGAMYLSMGLGSFVLGGALVAYAVQFVRKLKHVR